MHDDDFVWSVQLRDGRSRDETERLVQATLGVLAEQLRRDEAEDLRAQLPAELHADLVPPLGEAESFEPDEFARRVARRARLSEDQAREGMVAVLATTRNAVQPGELDHVLAQFGAAFARIVPGSAQALPVQVPEPSSAGH